MDFQEMFFSFDGRLNRKPYILRFLLRNAIIWCLGYLIGSLFAPDGTMFQILAFALTFIAALSCLSLYVRRLHDLDHGSLMVLLAFIPLISLFRQSVQSAFHAHQQIPRQDHRKTVIGDL